MATLVADALAVERAAREPWPDSVSLYQPYEVDQILLPDFANSLTVKAFLKMCGLNFDTKLRTNAEHMSPSGKLPFIQIGPLIVSEIEPIIALVAAKGHNLSADLNDEQKAEMKAYMALVDNVLVNAELYISWINSTVLTEVTRPRYGSMYAWPLNKILPWRKQWEMAGTLKSLGWARRSMKQVCDEVHTCCSALSEKLGEQKYFWGEKPTELDALVYGHLYALLTTQLPVTDLADTVRQFQNLTDFCTNIDKSYFKEKERRT